MLTWRLTKRDLQLAVDVGRHRYAEARQRDRRQVGGEMSREQRLISDIRGVQAEIVIHRLTGLPWNSPRVRSSGPDVGPFGVRHTIHDPGHLIVRDSDPLERVMILVSGGPHEFKVEGWLSVLAVRTYPKKRLAKNREPVHCAEVGQLLKIRDVKQIIRMAASLTDGRSLRAA